MRIYHKDNKKYLSVTSIIELREPFDRESFDRWCDKNGHDSTALGSNSAVMGEKVSRYIWDISQGLEELTEPIIDSVEKKLRQACDKFLEDYSIVSTEKEVYCDGLNYAGRYDGVVKDSEGEEFLVDFKTYGAWKSKPYKRDSKKIKLARWQTTLYAHAMDWTGSLAVVVFKNNGDYEIELLPFDLDMLEWVKDNQDRINNLISQ